MSRPSHLQIRSVETHDLVRPDLADIACLGELCQAFAEATGWPLRFVPEPEPAETIDLLWSAPVNPGVGESPGHLRIDLCGAAAVYESMRADWHAAEHMAGAISELVNELFSARRALREREAELAAAVPVKPHQDEQAHLAARLEATLRAGAQGIGCQAAALYVLDDATSQLKLRAAWGLPLEKFTAQARPLAQQMADLEALMGHAVALETRADMVGRWRPPEPAAAALCIPVSSPTIPFGTVWFFSQSERAFSDEQTNIAEVVAGKIASDLERTALIKENSSGRDIERQIAVARRTQEHQLPVVSPPIPGWTLGGWAEPAADLGGAFYDWRMLDDSSLLLMLGDACDTGLEAALASTALRAALRAGEMPLDIDELLRRANRILWESSAGNWWAGLWLAQLNLADGRCHFAGAGRPSALWLKPDSWVSLIKPSEPLGLEPNQTFGEKKPLLLAPGQSLVICNRGIMESSDVNGRPLDEAALSHLLLKELSGPPQRSIDSVRDWLTETDRQFRKPQDRSMLVVQRLPR
ncbi:MAG TPA: SpoIIE family protein phosphatase [Pirellulales bacterium]